MCLGLLMIQQDCQQNIPHTAQARNRNCWFPVPVNWTGAYRSWTKRGSPIHTASSINSEPSYPGSISSVRGVGPWGAAAGALTPDDSWCRPRGDLLDGSSTLLEGDGWTERPITPTLLGFEILDERAKFTVYKILVTGCQGDSWVIFRRYTDFSRLSDKSTGSKLLDRCAGLHSLLLPNIVFSPEHIHLNSACLHLTLKELFPSFSLALPSKRWFKDNYDEAFLEERQIGLQTFLQNLTLHKDIISSEAVKHFLCLVDPPGPFDSLEESRAFCETLEETNHRLQRELLENQRDVDMLKKTLEEKENHTRLLVKKVKSRPLSTESFEDICQLTALITTDTYTHTEGETDVNTSDQKHTDGNEEADDDRAYLNQTMEQQGDKVMMMKGHEAY
ncbi:sorting nexin-16-like isoform X2 [Dicentrarchus labrax]|uniref:sorting nexin-16-like isoform X2 n=1 Tax=Dicentrarchus labrax TaxID=13489 RepID=UPI0016390657|nr:sorting nexin-16-like isoform X2 [Dicentrarchus labrax]